MTELPQRNNSKLSTLDPFREVNNTFPQTAEIVEHKHRGGKVFGFLCAYVPEEIIHAAGALPVRITGYSQEMELEDGNAYLHINNCSFSRSCLQMAIKGEYDFLDGLIAGSTCDGARRLFDLWHYYLKTPFLHILTVPRKYTQRAHDLYHSQVIQFKHNLEKFLGIQITDEALCHSIEVYNETRTLLKNLYDLRKLSGPPLTGAETIEVLSASFRTPKELFNEYLRQLLDELATSSRSCSGRARLMVVSSVMDNPEFIKSIEAQGGLVVTDELCTTTPYWSGQVVMDDNKTLLEVISQRYLGNFPCARMVPSDERFNGILELVHDFKVEGVICPTIRHCVPYLHDLPLLTNRLKAQGIPCLILDVEYGTSGSGQIQTRVQAFLEMLEAMRQ